MYMCRYIGIYIYNVDIYNSPFFKCGGAQESVAVLLCVAYTRTFMAYTRTYMWHIRGHIRGYIYIHIYIYIHKYNIDLYS